MELDINAVNCIKSLSVLQLRVVLGSDGMTDFITIVSDEHHFS